MARRMGGGSSICLLSTHILHQSIHMVKDLSFMDLKYQVERYVYYSYSNAMSITSSPLSSSLSDHHFTSLTLTHSYLYIQDLKNSQSDHDQTEAAKLLIQEALKDPLNERFVLLSSDTIPLYSPTTLWQQLANDDQSKINACSNDYKHTMVDTETSSNSTHRKMNDKWLPPLEMATSTFQPTDHWRSSSQWFVLNRGHAVLVAQDKELASCI